MHRSILARPEIFSAHTGCPESGILEIAIIAPRWGQFG
jgi:hypothetical protein